MNFTEKVALSTTGQYRETPTWQVTGKENPVFSKGCGDPWMHCRICIAYLCWAWGCHCAVEGLRPILLVVLITTLDLLVANDVLATVSQECSKMFFTFSVEYRSRDLASQFMWWISSLFYSSLAAIAW